MDGSESPALRSIFRFVIARRWWFVALYAALIPPAILLALRVETDNSIARLVVAGDEDFTANQSFQRIFPEGEQAILLVEAADPFAPGVTDTVETIEKLLRAIPRVQAFSALDLYDRAGARAGSERRPEDAFRAFATGTDMLRKQGLVGPDFLGVAMELDVGDARQRDEILAAIDRALLQAQRSAPPVTIRRIGGPYVDSYLEAETARASARYFPLFGLFIVCVSLALYRSVRTLAAFLLTLAVCVCLTVGFARVAGFTFSIVSSLVPLTILITASAALVYIQSRFAEHTGDGSVMDHQVFTLANKFVATTASIFAAAIGFASLSVSDIRPIREMGLWVAAGLVMTWVVVFTLFPALQCILATPTGRGRGPRRLLDHLVHSLPCFTHRWRWVILSISVILMIAGAAAVVGVPGHLTPMSLETDSLDYIDRSLPLYQDMRRFEQAISGLSVIQLWVTTPPGEALRPDILRGLEAFSTAIEKDERVGSVAGPTTLLRFTSYVAGQGDRLSEDPEAWTGLAAQLDQILLEEPASRDYVDVGSMSDVKLTVVYRGEGFRGADDLRLFVQETWNATAAGHPAMASCRLRVVGQGLLQAKIAENLVPTLTESFVLTAAVIFVSFLLVFKSGTARLMAMIPSVFAILVMFLAMRLTGVPLNVATILIASTVLGASENDQIHFFYHFQERRDGGSTLRALRHALLIAGRGILFATLINAGGFSALALSGLPPMRQFGMIAAGAFLLSMIASLTALPAAIWIVSGDSPDESVPSRR